MSGWNVPEGYTEYQIASVIRDAIKTYGKEGARMKLKEIFEEEVRRSNEN